MAKSRDEKDSDKAFQKIVSQLAGVRGVLAFTGVVVVADAGPISITLGPSDLLAPALDLLNAQFGQQVAQANIHNAVIEHLTPENATLVPTDDGPLPPRKH